LLGPALRPYLDSLDVVQSVHRSLLLGVGLDRFDISTPEQLIALATTMVRHKVAHQWRHMRRQQRLTGGAENSGDLPSLLTSLTSSEADPARAAQFNDTVRHLCANLDATEQRVLEMRLAGHSTAEIAEALAISAVALRVRMTRLRQRLRSAGVLDDWL